MHTQRVDYINAFCQSPLEHTVFAELLVRFETSNKVILLKQPMYGLRRSPLNLYKLLRKKLDSRGFVNYYHDDCLFTNGNVIILLRVDNCIFYSQNDSSINKLIVDLKYESSLEKEEDMQNFWVYRLIHKINEK